MNFKKARGRLIGTFPEKFREIEKYSSTGRMILHGRIPLDLQVHFAKQRHEKRGTAIGD